MTYRLSMSPFFLTSQSAATLSGGNPSTVRVALVSLAVFMFLNTASAQQTQIAADAGPAAAEIHLHFSDFFRLPVGPSGLELTPALLQASGKQVVLTGYMVQQEHGSKPGQFFFTPRPVQMSEHADGDADDLPPATVLVKLAREQATWIIPHTSGLIQLQGLLSVGRQEASDGRVTWVQLQLKPEATHGMSPVEFEGYLQALQHRH
ncbi:MAG: hypothetical protein KGN32_10015 [Burkholderiales bacterium]|nr:hypothetical protein [Burkholderiales bacterium]